MYVCVYVDIIHIFIYILYRPTYILLVHVIVCKYTQEAETILGKARDLSKELGGVCAPFL
jgi:hypothetical protein